MQAQNSDFASLFTEETRFKMRRVRRVFEALLFTAALFSSGLFTGYWVATQQGEKRLAQQDRLHLEELARTSKTYETSLSYLTGRVSEAAATAESAATTAESAASTADKSARSAEKASKQVGKSSDRVPEPTREQINRSVQRANSAILAP